MKHSGYVFLEGTLDEFRKYPSKGAKGREYMLLVKNCDGTFSLFQKDNYGKVFCVSGE